MDLHVLEMRNGVLEAMWSARKSTTCINGNLTVSSPQHHMGRAWNLIGHRNDYLHAFSISTAAHAGI
jgi:hypothetical protein